MYLAFGPKSRAAAGVAVKLSEEIVKKTKSDAHNFASFFGRIKTPPLKTILVIQCLSVGASSTGSK